MSNELSWGLWEFDDEFVFALPRPLALGAVRGSAGRFSGAIPRLGNLGLLER
jgi:hypothetical protein